jgi:hypothetical protein
MLDGECSKPSKTLEDPFKEDIITYYNNSTFNDTSETEVHEDDEDEYKIYQRQDLLVHSGIKKKSVTANERAEKQKGNLIIEKLDSKVKADLAPKINYSSFAKIEKGLTGKFSG